ncbi:hypothetical protein Acr_00g0033680 [Actinidia rufa]|uniref:Uncharacterized protein n=1 Tax=Actinidia rufa TaxID=165716 RepID=A0A7J0DG85_9ERIC|nr:hypothetical protein Acr_00g0033680 [Actinidia rufa]
MGRTGVPRPWSRGPLRGDRMAVVPSVPFLYGVRRTQLTQSMEAPISQKQDQIWHDDTERK